MNPNKIRKNILMHSKGFSLLEVLLGISVFMIGMLGVTALNISSLKSNTFSGNMSEAVTLAGDRIEELMQLDFEDDLLIDTDSDGTDQDDAANPGVDLDGGNFGLDDTGGAADHCDTGIGKNGIYTVCWNIAAGEPLPERTKTLNVIVEWSIKDVKRTMNMSTVILDYN